MRIVHLIPANPVFKDIMIKYFNSNLAEYNFDFIIARRSQQEKIFEYSASNVSVVNMTTPDETVEQLKRIVAKYDLVVFHSILISQKAKIKILLSAKDIISKIVWIAWGFDIYYPPVDSVGTLMKNALRKTIRKCFERRIPYFIYIHPVDQHTYDRNIGGKADKHFAMYGDGRVADKVHLDYRYVSMLEKTKKGEPIVIQVGHRAEKLLRHKTVLDQLSKYAHENIRIIIPLSYGSEAYGDEIESYAKGLFAEKVVCLRKVLPREEYARLLESVDIFILNATRQIALGNLFQMMVLKKKIYMPEKSILKQHYEQFDIPILNIKDIGRVSFEQLTTDVDMTHARQHVIDYRSIDRAELWRKAFDGIIAKHSKCHSSID